MLKEITNKFKHIKEASEAILTRLRVTRRTCLIMPTGTGKTLVSGVIVGNLGLQTMYLCPNTYILEQTKEKYARFGISGVTFMTYQEMVSRVKSDDIGIFSGIELFILDEFHRLGADVWGKCWLSVDLLFPASKILGLTATEHRYLDGGRDMALELFSGDVGFELSMEDCVAGGILRTPVYVLGADITSGISAMEDKVAGIMDEGYRKKIKKDIQRLKGNWTRTKGVSEFYRKYILENPEVDFHRILVFHERINETEGMKKLVTKTLREAGWEGKITFYIANSNIDNPGKEIQEFSKEGKDKEIKILLSINMCNEGLHIPGVSVEVMYRSTSSKNIFLQQVGRVMSLEGKGKPVILDLVQNLSSSNMVSSGRVMVSSRGKGKGRNPKNPTPEWLEIIDETLGYQEICKAMDNKKSALRKERVTELYKLVLSGDLTPFQL